MAKLGKRTRAAREAFAGKDNLSVEEAVALVKGNANAKFDETVEIAMNLGRRSAPCRPDGPRRRQPAQRHRQDRARGGLRPRRQGRRGRGGRGRHRRRRGPDGDHPGRQDRLRPLHRHPRHDADRRPSGQGPGPAQPDAEPQGRHRDHGREGGRRGGQGRPGAVQGREGRRRSMPASARRPSTRPSWSRTCAPSSMRCRRPSRRAPRAPT